MNATEIQKINDANFILRHFVDLSARLLPFLRELQLKKSPTQEDLQRKQKIIEVYEGYSFDTSTSEMLINSNILELIKESFDHLSGSTPSRIRSNSKPLRLFLSEYERLRESWDFSSAN